MKRWGILLGITVSLLVSGIAVAGGAGSIRLARPLDRVAAGEALLYLQALQHDIHPLPDAKVTVKGSGPQGTGFEVEAKLDPAYGEKHVYQARLPLKAEGRWQLTVTAGHWVQFPPVTLSVEVLPAGSNLPEPGPVRPQGSESAGHSHAGAPAAPAAPAQSGTRADAAQPAAQTVSQPAAATAATVGSTATSVTAVSGPGTSAPEAPGARPSTGRVTWVLGAGVALAAAGAAVALGLYLARRRPARV